MTTFDEIKSNQQKSLVLSNENINSVINKNVIEISETEDTVPRNTLDSANETEVKKSNIFINKDNYNSASQSKEIEISTICEEYCNSMDDSPNEILDLSLTSTNSSKKLRDFLQKPPTPKRKGKKFTEKTSYAISSKEWKLKEEEKINKQKMELKRKETRKLEILEKKKLAEKMKSAKKVIRTVKKEKLDNKENKSKKLSKTQNNNAQEKTSLKNKSICQRKTKPKIVNETICTRKINIIKEKNV